MSISAKDAADLSRRNFLKVGTAAGGGLMLGFQVGDAFAQEKKGAAEAAAPAPAKYVLNPNAFIAIAPDGKISFQIPQEEMGQGVYTSLSQLLADELDVDLANVTPLPAPPIDAIYGSPRSHRMSTGGSTSIRGFYTALRQVGALQAPLRPELVGFGEPRRFRQTAGDGGREQHHTSSPRSYFFMRVLSSSSGARALCRQL